jgi:hypothetical protein
VIPEVVASALPHRLGESMSQDSKIVASLVG